MQDIVGPVLAEPNNIYWGQMCHIQTPLEDFPPRCQIVIRLRTKNSLGLRDLGWVLYPLDKENIDTAPVTLFLKSGAVQLTNPDSIKANGIVVKAQLILSRKNFTSDIKSRTEERIARVTSYTASPQRFEAKSGIEATDNPLKTPRTPKALNPSGAEAPMSDGSRLQQTARASFTSKNVASLLHTPSARRRSSNEGSDGKVRERLLLSLEICNLTFFVRAIY